MGAEQVLDLLGADVLTLADDHVLEAPSQREVAIFTEHPKVAGPEPALLVERIVVERRVGVTPEHHRTLDPDLSLVARCGHLASKGDDPHGGALDRRAIGVGELLIGVMWRTVGDHGDFGHAVPVDHATPADLVAYLEVEVGRLGSSTTGHQAERREDRGAWLRTLLVEVRDVEGGGAADHGHLMAIEQLDGVSWDERLKQDSWESEAEHGDEVVGPSDVGEGEGDRTHVVGRHVERTRQAPATCDEGLVCVLDTLRLSRRSRGVVDPADRVVAWLGPRRGRSERGRVTVRHALGEIEDPSGRADRVRCSPSDRHEVDVTPRARHDQHLRASLLESEADLALFVEMDDRVLHGTDASQRVGDDDGLDRGGELPAHWRALLDPQRLQASRCPLHGTLELAEGQRPASRIEEHRVVW